MAQRNVYALKKKSIFDCYTRDLCVTPVTLVLWFAQVTCITCAINSWFSQYEQNDNGDRVI